MLLYKKLQQNSFNYIPLIGVVMRLISKIQLTTIIQSLLFMAGGVLCLAIPTEILANASLIIGISIIVFGLSEIFVFFTKKEYKTESFALAYSFITIAIGTVILSVNLNFLISIVPALWVLISSIFKFIPAINDSINKCTNIASYVDAFITLALGVLLVIRFYEGTHATMLVLGIYLLYLSIKPIFDSIKFKLTRKNVNKGLDKVDETI